MARTGLEHPRLSAFGRTATVLFICAGIAGLGLLSGGEQRTVSARRGGDPMAGYFGPDMPRYPGAQEMPAGAESSLGGAQVRMAFFDTPDEPAKVGRFYADYWRGRELYVRSDVTHMGGVVSGVDGGKNVVYQVLINRQRGRTLVFPSVTHAPLSLQPEAGEPPSIALYPKSRVLSAYSSKEHDATARVHLSVNGGTLEENLGHYQSALAAAGYRPDSGPRPELEEGHRVLVYRAGDKEITVNLRALGDGTVRVHILEATP